MLIKVTDGNGRTRGGTQWGVGVTHEAAPGEPVLCSETVLHCYEVPDGLPDNEAALVPVLLKPLHVDYSSIRVWELEPGEVVARDSLKCGMRRQTIRRELPVPEVGLSTRVRWALLVVNACVPRDQPALYPFVLPAEYSNWLECWLTGRDRSANAAEAACVSAERGLAAAWAEARAAVRAAVRAAKSAWAAAATAEADERAAEAEEAAARTAVWAVEADGRTLMECMARLHDLALQAIREEDELSRQEADAE